MRTAAEVHRRIVTAARAEFARYGFAGARIDRIAKEASASKERLYAYFADKQALFEAVLALGVDEFFEAVTIRDGDLPEFVGAVFDHAHSTPDHLRILTWARLDDVPLPTPTGSHGPLENLDAIRHAQELGTVDPSWNPRELLTILLAVGLAWAQAPDFRDAESERDLPDRRAAAVLAARRIVTP